MTESSLENARYRVQLNQDGDVSSIYDKSLNKELLSAPIRLAISTDVPKQYPAWNMDFDQEQAAPRAYVERPGADSRQGEWPGSGLPGSDAPDAKTLNSCRRFGFQQAMPATGWNSATPSIGEPWLPISK